MRRSTFLRRRRTWAGAQTTAEYAIITFWLVLGFVLCIETVRTHMLQYYYDVVSMMCLPIP